jgi:hypothetical protein
LGICSFGRHGQKYKKPRITGAFIGRSERI